jgi:hypothetical protein
MLDAARALLDEDAVRWPAPELFAYLNDGLKAVAEQKPNAWSQTVTLPLVRGTLQTLPSAYRSIRRITRNLTVGHGEPGGPVGGNAIRALPSSRNIDALLPNWQSDQSTFGAEVKHVIYDLADPRRYYVLPGNDGTGKIEAVVLALPPTLAAPVSGANAIASYTATIPLGDEYKNALRDYVLARAYAKDAAVPSAEARAAAYMQMFVAQIQALAGGEGGGGSAARVA